MSTATDDYARIRDATDNYEILDLTHPTNEKAVNEAYRKLAIKFHPDKLRSGLEHHTTAKEKMMAEMVLQEGTRLFNKIQDAAESIRSELARGPDLRRRESERTSPKSTFGSARTGSPKSLYGSDVSSIVPYSAKPPHMSDPAPHRRSTMPSFEGPDSDDDDYQYTRGARGRSSTVDAYAPHHQQQRQWPPGKPSRAGSDLGFGPQAHGGKEDPFDLFGGMPGFGSQGDDKIGDMFNSFFGGNAMGSGGGLLGNGNNGSDDMFGGMMEQLGLGGGGGGAKAGVRGGFASHTITRRHHHRDGRQTLDKQHRSMAMMDHGAHGKVMVESSYRIRGVTDGSGGRGALGGGGRAGSGRGADPFSSSAGDPFGAIDAPPAYSPHMPPRSRRTSMGGPSPAPYGHHGPAGYLTGGGGGGGNDDLFGLDRMIGAPPPQSSRDLMPFGRGGHHDLSLTHMPRPVSTDPYSFYR